MITEALSHPHPDSGIPAVAAHRTDANLLAQRILRLEEQVAELRRRKDQPSPDASAPKVLEHLLEQRPDLREKLDRRQTEEVRAALKAWGQQNREKPWGDSTISEAVSAAIEKSENTEPPEPTKPAPRRRKNHR